MRLLLVALIAEAMFAQQKAPKAEDIASPDAVVKAVYSVISGNRGQPRDWNRMRGLFLPGAKLIGTRRKPGTPISVRIMDVEGYISATSKVFESVPFFESETARKTETFGAVVHVFSTYQSKRSPDDAQPFARGINSFQLLQMDDRWWVVSLIWDSETLDNPIPAEYK